MQQLYNCLDDNLIPLSPSDLNFIIKANPKTIPTSWAVNILAQFKPSVDINQIFKEAVRDYYETSCNSYELMANSNGVDFNYSCFFICENSYKLDLAYKSLRKISPSFRIHYSKQHSDYFDFQIPTNSFLYWAIENDFLTDALVQEVPSIHKILRHWTIQDKKVSLTKEAFLRLCHFIRNKELCLADIREFSEKVTESNKSKVNRLLPFLHDNSLIRNGSSGLYTLEPSAQPSDYIGLSDYAATLEVDIDQLPF